MEVGVGLGELLALEEQAAEAVGGDPKCSTRHIVDRVMTCVHPRLKSSPLAASPVAFVTFAALDGALRALAAIRCK